MKLAAIARRGTRAARAAVTPRNELCYARRVSRPANANGFAAAMELYELAEALVRQRYRRDHPRASRRAVEAEVTRWRLARPGAEHGDYPGRRVPWPHPNRS